MKLGKFETLAYPLKSENVTPLDPNLAVLLYTTPDVVLRVYPPVSSVKLFSK